MNQNEKIEYVKNYLQERINKEFLFPFKVTYEDGKLCFTLKQDSFECNVTHKNSDYLIERIIKSTPSEKDKIIELLFETLMNAVNSSQKIILLRQNRYDEVKRQLILRPLNFDNSQADLKDVPHIRFGDIALVLYGVVSHNGNDYFTTKITRNKLEHWGITEADVLKDALVNTSRLYPPRLYSVQALLLGNGHTPDINFMQDETIMHSGNNSSYILTNSIELNGAAVIFYPDVLTKLADFLGKSFYIAFTSIHEAQVHIKDGISEDIILNALQDTNRHCNSKEEILSDKVYFYNKDRRTFGVLENGEFKKLWQIAGEDK